MANHSSHSSSSSSFFPEPAMEPAWLWSLVSSPGGSTGGGSSPASSPDSCGGGFWPPEEGPHLPWRGPPGLVGPGRGKAGGGGAPRARLAHGQRQTASQREKLRMRHLAQALHALRRYLPGSGGQVGQNLTKIETLRLAIRYIAHLSELLGLSEEELARRRGAAARARPGCPLCPPGLGCCQASSSPVPFPQPRAAAPTPAAAAAAAAAPGPASSSASSPAASWGLSRSAPASCAAASGNPGQEPPGWATFGPGAELLQGPVVEWPPPAGDLPGHPQSLPDELLSFLEGFVPLALQDFLSPTHPLPAVLPPGPEARKEYP